MRALALTVMLVLPGAPALAALSCPERLPEAAPAPFERQGLGAGRGNRSPLTEAWVVQGEAGEETKPAPAISAPDSSSGRPPRFTNSWDLSSRDPMLLVCIYRDGVWLRAPLPEGTRRCVQSGEAARMTMRCE